MAEDNIELVIGRKRDDDDDDDDDDEEDANPRLEHDNPVGILISDDDNDDNGDDDDKDDHGGGGGGGDDVSGVNNGNAGSTAGVLGILKPDANESDMLPSEAPANQRVTFRGKAGMKIDYVLMYRASKKDGGLEDMRASYEENLRDFGIKIEREESDKDCFVMLHCPFKTLCKGAELMKLKKPIKKQAKEADDDSSIQHNALMEGIRNKMVKKKKKKMLIHQPFIVKNKDQFVIENEKTFFTSAERNYILHNIMERTMFKNKDRVQTGLGCLLGYDAYISAYPLHDPMSEEPLKNTKSLNEREELYENWVKPKNVFKSQPLDDIRSYFGEQFTFYFAWMELYVGSLVVAALAGIICFVYGLTSFSTIDMNVREICDGAKAPGNFVMCPKCDSRCNFTILSSSCGTVRFARVFDNEATLSCAIFICVWAICFMELWKRKQLALQHEWNVVDFEADENVRPEFISQTNEIKKNPWSGADEYSVSFVSKLGRTLTSISVLLFLLSVVVVSIFAVLVYRLALVYALYESENETLKKHAKIITTLTAAILNVLAITLLGFIYQRLAKVLTNLEAHKTRTSYEDSFIMKIVVFQCINNYGSIIYIAFLKGSFVDRPGQNNMYMFHRYKQDECDDSGCFYELTIQLIIVMIGKQFLNALIEMLAPIFKKCFRARDNRDQSKYMQWERDLDLEAHPSISMFGEYLEMVIQYGFVVLFVVAFPLAPFFAFLNNVIEIRLDAYKMVKLFRRCPALKAQDIGAWQVSLQAISHIAVITNAFIIAWTSDFIPKQVYKWNTGFYNMSGYMEWNLATFNVSDFLHSQKPDVQKYPESANVTQCKYKTYSAPPDQIDSSHIPYYWQIQCARWAFVIVFEHCAFLLMSLIQVIPSQSESVRLKVEYEKALQTSVEVDDLFARVKRRRKILSIVSSPGIAGNNVGFSDAVQE